MFVTPEVSKFSGWLNAVANCRKEGIRCAARCRVPGGGRWRARLTAGGGGVRAERTENISCMVVTLDVSKPSGWLNADAPCRESKRGHMRCGARCRPGGGRWRATAVCTQRAGEGSAAAWEQGTGRSALGTCRSCL
eukprot:scaffold22564_cov67-Phaeocystis_antarctica.AAC.4